jgi:hypothetical protein
MSSPFIPDPPVPHALASGTTHTVFLLVSAVLLAVALVVAARLGARRRNLFGVLTVLGGCLAVVQEPVIDVLGNCYLAHNTPLIAISTFRVMPLWALLIYGTFFGFLPYVTYLCFEHGISRRTFWLIALVEFAADLAIEIPTIAKNLWFYYGDPPFELFGLPLYWVTINVPGGCVVASILYLRRDWLSRGWRQLVVFVIPVVAVSGTSIATGLPVFTALNSPGLPRWAVWTGGAATIVIGLVVMDCAARVCCGDSRWRRWLRPDQAEASPAEAAVVGSVAVVGRV